MILSCNLRTWAFACSIGILLSLSSPYLTQRCLAQQSPTPNFLFILADDLAWSDLGCYGHVWHRTPHLDHLAAQGMRMTSAYAPAPICSASRASIVTGKTTARLGFEFVTKDRPGNQQIDAPTLLTAPPMTLNLPLQENTIAERLNGCGYETAFFGKWHLNQHHEGYLGWSPTHGPAQQGFRVAVEDFGAHPYAWSKSLPRPIERHGQYTDDSMIDKVCEYLEQPHEQPFFAMVSSFYVHTPIKTPCQWLIDEFDAIIPTNIENRQARLRYAAFLQTLDHHVGEIMSALQRSGQLDQTLIVFLSDNGGHPEYTANAPLRGSKWNLYEGGIRVPMIASWPGRIPAGSTSDVPVIGYDLLPTLVQIAGGTTGNVDGVSLSDLWQRSSIQLERSLLWHFPYYHPERGYADALDSIGIDDFRVSKTTPQSALRRGKYKLVWIAETDQAELYNLDSDLGEQHDLKLTFPQVAGSMLNELRLKLAEAGARMATH